MLRNNLVRSGLHRCIVAGGLAFATYTHYAALSDGLVSYWPMEEVQGTRTPDRVSGYDMTLGNLAAADLVDGKIGKCFNFSNAKQTILRRVHAETDDLPANKHEAFTIAFWANVTGTGQTDLRLFSEGFTPNDNNPLFNIGTHSTAANGAVDLFIRHTGWTAVSHIVTEGEPLDGTWHHITFVQNADGTRKFYIDGVADPLEIPAREAGRLKANDTTIGGILRASESHWVTGLIDEVAIWKRALTEAEITQLNGEGLTSIFPPEADGLVAHWPMDEIQGTRTPDVVSGYDMTLNNLSAADQVDGRVGKTFSFSNAKQTLLSRIHAETDDLPANKHEAFTITFWANVTGMGQTDLRLFSEGFTPNDNNPLFNIGTHSTAANGAVDLFIRHTGWTTVNHIVTEGEPLDGTWHHITFLQNADGTRKFYFDGVADPLEIPVREAGLLKANDTTIGGILRASPSHWVTGLIDEVAIWKRALTEPEIAKVVTNGVPAVFKKLAPLEIRSFVADFRAVAAGDKVVLHWEGNTDATYTISGIGDVTTKTSFGVGSTEVTVPSATTYTLTAARGNETVSKDVRVDTVGGVAPGWHVLDTFTSITNGPLSAQTAWLAADGIYNAVDLGTNVVVGFDDGDDLTALNVNAWKIAEGQKGTVSFRVYVVPTPVDEPILPITAHIGITERSIRFIADFAQNVGPYLRIQRLADTDLIELQARNGVGTGVYEIASDAIVPGEWYRVWIDVDNRPFDVVDGVQNGGDIYSIYIQKEGDAQRTRLFDQFVADRDAINVDPALGAPTRDLTHVFVSGHAIGQGVNRILFDDFLITVGDYSSTIPNQPVSGPSEIRITNGAYDSAAGRFTVTWESTPGISYIVQRKTVVTDPWQNAGTVPAAAGATTSFSEAVTATTGFYRVAHQP